MMAKYLFLWVDLLKNFNFIPDMQNKYCTADIQDEEGEK